MEHEDTETLIKSNIKIFTQYQYCDMHSVIDLIIKEDNKISIAHFIGSDENIPDMEIYMNSLLYYFTLLRDLDEFKDYEFNNIYLHSLKNNKRYELRYEEELEEDALDYLGDITKSIHDNNFVRDTDNCETCEYYGNVCKG